MEAEYVNNVTIALPSSLFAVYNRVTHSDSLSNLNSFRGLDTSWIVKIPFSNHSSIYLRISFEMIVYCEYWL